MIITNYHEINRLLFFEDPKELWTSKKIKPAAAELMEPKRMAILE